MPRFVQLGRLYSCSIRFFTKIITKHNSGQVVCSLCLRSNQKIFCRILICSVLIVALLLYQVFSKALYIHLFPGSLYTLRLVQHFHAFFYKTITQIRTHVFTIQTLTEFLLSMKQSVWHQVKQQTTSVLLSRREDKHSQPPVILDYLIPQPYKGLVLYISKPPPKLAKILRI